MQLHTRGISCRRVEDCRRRTLAPLRAGADSGTAGGSSGGGGTAHGKCWLVGAGPGPSDLLTLRAVRALESAQVVVYDDLGAQEALALAPPSAELLYVGKRGGVPSIKQGEIDSLIVDRTRQGLRVVRLKGGCPSVFSRVGSELRALAAAGCEYEIVPGVSSALAAPLFAGFPLTDTTLGRSFAVTAGHDVEGTDWAAMSGADTLVVLMGGSALPRIAEHLVEAGKPRDTPVAVIRAAGTPEQRVWRSTLGGVAADTAGHRLSPCIIVAGAVAAAFPRPAGEGGGGGGGGTGAG